MNNNKAQKNEIAHHIPDRKKDIMVYESTAAVKDNLADKDRQQNEIATIAELW